jgi:hypothetical protein
MLGRGASFLAVPVGQGLVYCYADVTTNGAASGDLDGDPIRRLRERFAGSPPRSLRCSSTSTIRAGSIPG